MREYSEKVKAMGVPDRVGIIGGVGGASAASAARALMGGIHQKMPVTVTPSPETHMPYDKWLESQVGSIDKLNFNARNSRQFKLRINGDSYPNNAYYEDVVHSIIREGDLRRINNAKEINPYAKNRTIVSIKMIESSPHITRYQFLTLDGGFFKLLNETKGFKFTGTSKDVICKQIIMWMYMKGHKYFKAMVLGIPLLGENVTRENFTKVLKEYSDDCESLLEMVIQERLMDFDNDNLNWG